MGSPDLVQQILPVLLSMEDPYISGYLKTYREKIIFEDTRLSHSLD